MIIAAFIFSGLLITGYAMLQGKGSDGPIYGSGYNPAESSGYGGSGDSYGYVSGYGSKESIPIPSGVLQSKDLENSVQGLLAQNPEDPTLLAELGDIYFERGEFFQAVQEYEKVIKQLPGDTDTYNDLGLAYFYTGRPEDAVSSFKTGIEKDPSFQRIWLSLGFVQASNKNMEEARKALKKAIEINPATGVGMEAQRILAAISQ